MEKLELIKKQHLEIIQLNINLLEKEKTKFSKSFEMNPAHSLEWDLERVIKAQTIFEIWHPVKNIIKSSNSLKVMISEIEEFINTLTKGLIAKASSSDSSSSRATNLSRAWKREQSFDCVSDSILINGTKSLPGLLRSLKSVG
jgi:hypothetical protein